MPMTQQDMLTHYEKEWKAQSDAAEGAEGLRYSDPVEDAVLYPAYEQLVRDFNIKADGGRVLDVGSGSGRWIRYFLARFQPGLLMGIDFSHASVELLEKWHRSERTRLVFRHADITSPDLDLDETFDLVNVANVLFHVPEDDLFNQALRNLGRLVEPDGFIVTTEYLPRRSFPTNWMMVRSRYEFEEAVRAAGLRVCDVRAFCFFANDPMGLDGPDEEVRRHFHKVRTGMKNMLASNVDGPTREFLIEFFAEIDRAALAFARNRIADLELPSQKLVVLKRV